MERLFHIWLKMKSQESQNKSFSLHSFTSFAFNECVNEVTLKSVISKILAKKSVISKI